MIEDIQAFGERVEQNLEEGIIGKRDTVELIVIGLLCQGHVLIEDVPGVGKTMLARSLARSSATTASRHSTRPAWAGLFNLIRGINFLDPESRKQDVLGRAYEYFLSQFAGAGGKKGGPFYTSRTVVRVLVEML